MTDQACGRARVALWPGQGPRPASPDVLAAQEHVAGCAACSAFFAEQATLSAVVRETDRHGAPEALRRRALAMVRGDRRPARLKVALSAAAAVVIFVGAVAIWWPSGAGEGVSEQTILSLFTAEHQRLVAGGGISSGNASEVTRWFAGRVNFALRVPEFAGGALRGGRLCMADGHRGAIVEYEFEGQMVSYFVLPIAVRGSPAELRRATQAGYRVVWWVQDGLLHGVVGGLPADRLEQLAKWCRELLGKSSGAVTGRPQPAVLPWEG